VEKKEARLVLESLTGVTQAWFMTENVCRVMTFNFYCVVTEMGHDPRFYFEKYSLKRIIELGILKISFRGLFPKQFSQ
jgi:hypothetical protein